MKYRSLQSRIYYIIQLSSIQQYLLLNMALQLLSKSTTASSIAHKLLKGPTLKQMPRSAIQQLRQLLQNSKCHEQYLQTLTKRISQESEVVLRIKSWVLIHLLLCSSVSHETTLQLEELIEHHEDRLNKKLKDRCRRQADKYFLNEVEIPYVSFLKKLTFWTIIKSSALQTDIVNLGFSQINKIKQILQLKVIFSHYSCYYPQHQYAFNIYQGCLINIKAIWRSVCLKIKQITLGSLKLNNIKEHEFMLIREAETLQDQLIEFVYGQKFSNKLPKQLKMHQINLLKPEIKTFQTKRKHKKSTQATLEIIEQKKCRKASMGTIDTSRSKNSNQSQGKNQICQKQLEQRLKTQQQIQILDSIKQLQQLLQYNE